MKWKLFANLAETAGTKEVEVGVEPGDTFRDALDRLLEAHPELRDEVLDEEGDLPVAVEVAVRSYTPSSSGDNGVDPQWRTTIVSLR